MNLYSEKQTDALYRKVGRKYVPICATWDYDKEQIKVGTFRLTYAYGDGGRRYEYEVTPATAPTIAAMLIARVAMEDALKEACKLRPSEPIPYTKRQLASIEQFKVDMGGFYPTWWTERSVHDISEAALRAVQEFKP